MYEVYMLCEAYVLSCSVRCGEFMWLRWCEYWSCSSDMPYPREFCVFWVFAFLCGCFYSWKIIVSVRKAAYIGIIWWKVGCVTSEWKLLCSINRVFYFLRPSGSRKDRILCAIWNHHFKIPIELFTCTVVWRSGFCLEGLRSHYVHLKCSVWQNRDWRLM